MAIGLHFSVSKEHISASLTKMLLLRYESCRETREIDHVEDGRRLGRYVELVEEVDEGLLIYTTLPQERSIRPNKASRLVLGASLWENDWHGKPLGSWWMRRLRVQLHEVSGKVFHGLGVDLVQRGFAFGVCRWGVVVDTGRSVVECPCCFVGVKLFFVGARVVAVVDTRFLLFGDGARYRSFNLRIR